MTGFVQGIERKDWIFIQFDKFIHGHEGNGNGRHGYCWGMNTRYIVPQATDHDPHKGLEEDDV